MITAVLTRVDIIRPKAGKPQRDTKDSKQLSKHLYAELGLFQLATRAHALRELGKNGQEVVW